MVQTTSPTSYSQPNAVSPIGLASAVWFGGVSRDFGQTRALDEVSFDIPIGSTVALLGPNGAGKSTAINVMLGLLHASSGSASVLGLEPKAAVLSGRVGAMLQSGGLPSGCLVRELVEFTRGLYPHPLPLDEALRTAGLTSLATRRVESLSGGETQRLRFAVAIAGDPDLVFLDEPTVAMDVETRHAFWNDMRRYTAEGRTVLFATHYLEEADQVADRVIVLDHGRVAADGTPGAIKSAASSRTIRFATPNPDAGILGALPGVDSIEIRGEAVTLTCSDADGTVPALYRLGISVVNIEVTGANLESAFLALTGGDRD